MPHPDLPQEPTVPTDQPAQKPVKTLRIGVYILMGLLGIFIVSKIFGAVKLTHQKSASATSPAPVTSDPDQVQRFQSIALKQQIEEQARQAEMVRQQLAQKLREQEAAAQEMPGQPPMTAAQRQAIYGNAGTSGGGTDPKQEARERAQELRRRREQQIQDSLNSTTIVVDRSGDTDKKIARSESPNKDVAPAPASTVEDSDQDKPKSALTEYDQYSGKLYRIFEGTVLDVVVTNQINGDAAGPILAMVTTDLYSHNHQKVLIPQGTRLIGDVHAVNSQNESRLFVAFHRAILPDGFSVSLDKFKGLSQVGDVGLRDKVNHHYMQIFGVSLAVGAIGGMAQLGNSGGYGYDPSTAIRNGISMQTSQEAVQILDRFLRRLPTLVVRPGVRSRIFFSNDLMMPAYRDHQMDPDL